MEIGNKTVFKLVLPEFPDAIKSRRRADSDKLCQEELDRNWIRRAVRVHDPERQLLYALANIRAQNAIASGVAQNLLRDEIRQATYAAFKEVKGL